MPELTAQQKLLEKIYREGKANRQLNTQQQRLNTVYKKPSAPQSNYTKLRGSTSVKAQSKARAVRQKYKGNFKRFGKQIKGAARRGKVSSAKNISKFNGGLRAILGSTITKVAPVATKLGAKAKTLGATISSSKFVAGAKASPVALLAIGNYAVWENNIRAISRIYDQRKPEATILKPPVKTVEQASIEDVLASTQAGVRYRFWVGYTYRYSYHAAGVPLETGVYTATTVTGSITGFDITLQSNTSVIRVVVYGVDNGVIGAASASPKGRNARIESVSPIIKQVEGDLNLSSTTKYQSSASGSKVNQAGDIDDPTKQKPPKLKLEIEKPKGISKKEVEANLRGSPLPSVVPTPAILPSDNTTVEPRVPTDSPRVVVDDNTKKTVQKKPRSVSKRIFYPEGNASVRPGSEVIRNNQTGVDTVIRRKYASDPNIPDAATEVTTELKTETDENGLPSIPPIYIPRLVEQNPSANQLPTATKINPCQRGCKGASSGASFTPGSDSATNLTGLINDQFVQNPLLKKIDATTTATKGAVFNPKFGLQKIQEFAQTAWKATHADKILNVMNTVMAVHNGMMLSTNLTVTVTEALNVGLSALGVEDSEGKPFDVTAILKGKLEALIKSLGIANDLEDFRRKLAPYNRIYQAAANTFDAARDLFDNAVSTAETAAENTGKIGNALIDARVVYEDAYEKMVDEFTSDMRAMGAFTRFKDKLEKIEDGVSTVENIAQSIVSTKDSFGELGESAKEWEEAKKAVLDKKEEDDKETKENSQVKAEIAKEDFDKAPPEEG